ncbi:MAG: AMP-binding protein, partial [Armatimonadota bacterium]|nr:AMP-binding protein [Armatimonadota bacterium]
MPHNSLLAMFRDTAERHPSAPALAAKVEGAYRPLTYGEAAAQVRRFGAALVRLGLAPGDRVALFCENRPEWAIADLGTYAAGGVVVPVYATLPLPQVEHIVRDSGARVLVASGPERAEAAVQLKAQVPALEHVLVVDAPAVEGTVSFADLLAHEPDAEAAAESDRRAAALTPETLATLVYTSGTTGEPKGAMLTHGNILANLSDADDVLRIDEKDVFLSFLPLCHIFERMAGYYLALRNGSAIYFAESVYTVARNLTEVRPTLMMSVPRLFENMQARVLDAAEKAPPVQRRLFHWALEVGREHSEYRLKHL